MANRARFETNQGYVTISRGTLSVTNNGNTDTYSARNVNWNGGKTLTVDIGDGMLSFQVTRTPQELRKESLLAFLPGEHGRLKRSVGTCQGMEAGKSRETAVEEANKTLAVFENRYGEFLPKAKKAKKAEASK